MSSTHRSPTFHPSAVISPQARIGQNVVIGPFCVVEEDAIVGDNCSLASHVVVKAGTVLGNGNRVEEGAVLGGLPQHAHALQQPGRLVIGDENTIREFVTIHRALTEQAVTQVGRHNLIMVHAHIAHDCHIGDHTIIANNVMLAGHVTVEDRAYLSGAVAVHQFCRIGRHAMVGGQAHLTKDVPPYVLVDGMTSRIVGLNTIGLRRCGFTDAQLSELKQAYRLIFRSGLVWDVLLERLSTRFTAGPAMRFYEFLRATQRGCVGERRAPTDAVLKLHRPGHGLASEEAAPQRRHAG